MTILILQTNQCQSYSIDLSDDSTDPNQTLGMWVSEDFFLPFQAKGPAVLFTSRFTKGEELYKIQQTVLTYDDWYPTQPCFTDVDQFSEYFEYKQLVSLVTMISTLTSTMTPMDSVYENSEYDIAMAEISPEYNDETFAILRLNCIKIATHVQ